MGQVFLGEIASVDNGFGHFKGDGRLDKISRPPVIGGVRWRDGAEATLLAGGV